ncbi:LOW QUALITY PROTEIN: metalloproteinase, extracellular matrix glycoprotein VMP33, partial [Volvox carteri f. nagariensis]
QWAIRQGDGSVTPMALGYEPPSTDDLGQDSSTTVLSAQPMFLPDATDQKYQQRLLVIIMDYSACGLPASLTEAAARTVFLGANGDGRGGAAQKYEQCSYGKLLLNATAFTAVTVNVSSCPPFTHYTYILPPGLKCPASAGTVGPGAQHTWLQTSAYGVGRWASILSATLHNYGGLMDSYNILSSYLDLSSPTGAGDVCPNAAELAYLGWATPAQGANQVDSRALPVGAALSFNLPATYLTPNGTYIRVVPDWLPTYSNITLAKNLYIAVRVNKGGDALLWPGLANKVHVHEVSASLRGTYLIGATMSLSQVVLSNYNLVVYGGSWIGTDILRVHICRYRSAPQEC